MNDSKAKKSTDDEKNGQREQDAQTEQDTHESEQQRAIATVDLEQGTSLEQVLQLLKLKKFVVDKVDKVEALGLATIIGYCNDLEPIRKVKGVLSANFDGWKKADGGPKG